MYRVRYKYDEHYYAIKKIKMKVKDVKGNFEEEVQKVLKEAKYLAQINHPNIIRYYNSWVEAARIESNGNKRKDGKKGGALATIHIPIKRASPLQGLKKKEESKPAKPVWDDYDDFADFQLEVNEMSADDIQFQDDDEEVIVKEESKVKLESKELGTGSPNRSTTSSNTLPEDLKHVIVYLQMELCAQTLERYLQTRNEKLEELRKKNPELHEIELLKYMEEAKIIVGQLLDGLHCIHTTYKLIHRDLKPSNIFLTDNLQVKIGDFGLVKKLETMTPMMPSPYLGPQAPPNASSFISEINPLHGVHSEVDNDEFVMIEEPRTSEGCSHILAKN